MMVPANAIGSIRLRGSPPIHALITPAFTLRLEIASNLIDKIRTRVPQFDVPHAGNELLDKPAETLAGLLGHLVDRPHTPAREAHKQQVKAPEKRSGNECGDRFKHQQTGNDYHRSEKPCGKIAKRREKKRGEHDKRPDSPSL